MSKKRKETLYYIEINQMGGKNGTWYKGQAGHRFVAAMEPVGRRSFVWRTIDREAPELSGKVIHKWHAKIVDRKVFIDGVPVPPLWARAVQKAAFLFYALLFGAGFLIGTVCRPIMAGFRHSSGVVGGGGGR